MSPTSEPRATLQAIWQTRPSRRQTDRKIAGVASAIARRYDIDPVLVRIAFVVAAFYGVGVLLYLAAWIALPPDPQDPPTGPLVRKDGGAHPVVLIAAVIAGLIGAGSLLHGDPGVLVGLAVLGGLLYLLHQSRGTRNPATTGTGPAAGSPAAPPATAPAGARNESEPSASRPTSDLSGEPAQATASPGPDNAGEQLTGPVSSGAPPGPERRTPPAWDPLGAAPFAWDLPEPGPAPGSDPTQPRRRPVLTLATIGLALLAGGITAALVLSAHGLGGIRMIIGVMLAVVGLGLLVGAFRRTGKGLIAMAIPLLLLGYAAAMNPIHQWHGAGDVRFAPTTFAELAPSYQHSLGQVTLDLRQLDFAVAPAPAVPAPPAPALPAAPPVAGQAAGTPAIPAAPPPAPANTGPVQTSVVLDTGEVTVIVPPNVDVQAHCHADLGSVNCLGQLRQPGDTAHVPGADLWVNKPGVGTPPGSRPLELTVTVHTGHVEVRRG